MSFTTGNVFCADFYYEEFSLDLTFFLNAKTDILKVVKDFRKVKKEIFRVTKDFLQVVKGSLVQKEDRWA